MPSEIHVRALHSTIGEDAAILTAFNTFVAAVKAATAFKVDAGGTSIGGKAYSADDATPHGKRPGEVW